MEPVLHSVDEALEAHADPKCAAEHAGLTYVSDEQPGIRRKRWGRGFTYLTPDGDHLDDEDVRARIDALAIPPAWTNVWICLGEDGHLQATGRDAQGRKQYIYHPAWQQIRSEAKFNRLILFGKALSQIRARCEDDLRRKGLPREKVLAVVISLLDRTLIRVGNPAYARQNGTFGLTTLRDRHVNFSPNGCTFEFLGKSGQKHQVGLNDPRLARLVRRCRDVPGYDLFQFYDADGNRGVVCADNVNAYLKETTGQDISAKDFRTWAGTVHAAVMLTDLDPYETEGEATRNITRMVKQVAERLGNTPAVCRGYYIHPAILDAYLDGSLLDVWPDLLSDATGPFLEPAEHALLTFLEQCLFETA